MIRFGLRVGLPVMVVIALLAAVITFVQPTPPQAAADKKTGIVLMHGLGDTPDAKSSIGKFAKEVESFGFAVVAPEMPWSKKRGLDKSFDDTMAEIDKAVAELKAKGVTRIAIGGQDLGANAAVAYGARHSELVGVLAIKPSVTPERPEFQKETNDAIKRAKEMVAGGKGDDRADFMDGVNGKKGLLKTTARTYVSWYDPEGPAVLPKNAARLNANTSFMWMVRDTDSIGALGMDYAFAKAPANPHNVYKVISGFHTVLGSKGANEVATWLKSL